MAPGFFKDEELTQTYALQRALVDEYGPSDKRIKKIEKAVTFRVDGCEIYEGADGNPLSHVCMIIVHVENDTKLTVYLQGNVPLEAPFQDWIAAMETIVKNKSRDLSFCIEAGEQNKLGTLATAMVRIVAPGRRYSTSYG